MNIEEMNSFIGLTIKEAKDKVDKLGLDYVEFIPSGCSVTLDYVFDRVRIFTNENEKVVDIRLG